MPVMNYNVLWGSQIACTLCTSSTLLDVIVFRTSFQSFEYSNSGLAPIPLFSRKIATAEHLPNIVIVVHSL
jgi:hypothetical protein